MKPLVFTIAVLLAGNALAFLPDGGTFVADFESPELLRADTPPGPWSAQTSTSPLNSFVRDSRARHAGLAGGRLIESGQPAELTWSATLEADGDLLSTQVFVRTWLRVVDPLPADCSWLTLVAGYPSVYVGAVPGPDGGVQGRLSLAGNDQQGFSSEPGRDGALTHGPGARWHLLEVEATGIGTPMGTRTMWLDGVEQANRIEINLIGFDTTPANLILGMPHADSRTFRGNVDFDDVWAGHAPLPNHAVISGESSGEVDACLAMRVTTRDVHQVPAAVPTALDFRPNAQVFNGEGCVGDAGVVRIEVGASEALFSVRFSSPGTQVLSAAHEQFLAGTDFTVTVRPRVVGVQDAGTEDGGIEDAGIEARAPAPRALDVQCGCSSAGAVFALGALALLRGLRAATRA